MRASREDDRAAIERLYPAAFPDEYLLPLVRRLLDETVSVLSLVAVRDEAVVGHALFTPCSVGPDDASVSLLGPLAVTPSEQGTGVGRAIVEAGVKQLAATACVCVLVLGDPGYYGRFGFARETRVMPPYAIPDEWLDAWQSVRASKERDAAKGNLQVPAPWRDPALWAP